MNPRRLAGVPPRHAAITMAGMRCRRVLPLLLAVPLWAAESDQAALTAVLTQLRESIPADQLAEPGSIAWPQALAELLRDPSALSLSERDLDQLRLALAEAWIGARQPSEADAALAPVQTRAERLSLPLRQRYGLARLGAWDLALDAGSATAVPLDPVEQLRRLGPMPPPVQARAHTVRARRQLLAGPDGNIPQVLADCDTALALLAPPAEPRGRVPVYGLRLLAMEAAGDSSERILAWVRPRLADPAMGEVASQILSAGQRLVGSPAPALQGPAETTDGRRYDLADWRGKPVLVFFFASWSQRSTAIVPALLAAAGETPVLGVSLDTRETVPALARWRSELSFTGPIIAEGRGWDSELDETWFVDALPSLLLVGSDGRVRATDLAGKDAAQTTKRVTAALAAHQRGEEPGGLLPDLANTATGTTPRATDDGAPRLP
jgi:thiol-disulfide isomerase/thioredoxin